MNRRFLRRLWKRRGNEISEISEVSEVSEVSEENVTQVFSKKYYTIQFNS